MHPCALKSDLMIVLTKNSNSLGLETPITMYSMSIFRLEVVLLIFMPIFPTVPGCEKKFSGALRPHPPKKNPECAPGLDYV